MRQVVEAELWWQVQIVQIVPTMKPQREPSALPPNPPYPKIESMASSPVF
jgi:hypothetical protein